MVTKRIFLHGDKVTLRTRTPEDMPVLYHLIYGSEQPEWKKYDAPYFPLESLSYEDFLKRWGNGSSSEEYPDDLVIEANDRAIGIVTYYWEHQPTRWLEAGIIIYLPEYWSGGYGTEALSLWVDFLFEHLTIGRVGITTWSGNPRMMRCAEKAGLKLEGRMRKCRYYNGEYYDSIRMGITREEWEAGRNRNI
ncbi:GNAT family N-acetyltransferase [Paenibacillus sp. DMB20]|uniref:GNAT family N-acetyltransferase n=1 Tax=Paenibacillus sp. DMB20 TaxID=1642570 RepID=UPI000627CE56|nr:GNAT family protein [Paenibacillus sp. DMB20]KKO52992.1 GCN5 family acetyltransferase [Paenibacillus sp. DMB20]KKO53515.1 GCN5 family acetyltransferase [Paenibacillus sp. DMB20]